jgi:hypothetical protein
MQQGGPARNEPYISTDPRGPGLVAFVTDPQAPNPGRVEERANNHQKVEQRRKEVQLTDR